MGLSGRKVKQRIPHDPRNLSWADDASRFGSTYLAKLGFDPADKSATLGVSGVGLAQHIKVHHKLDLLGVGAQHTKDPNGIAWKQNRDFENLLKRLNADSENPAEDPHGLAPIDGFQPAHTQGPIADRTTDGPETEKRDEGEKTKKEKKNKRGRPRDDEEVVNAGESKSKKRKQVPSTASIPTVKSEETGPSGSSSPAPQTISASNNHRRGRAHRARFINSKRLAANSSTAVAEILGISSSSVTPLSSSGIATPENTPPTEADEPGLLTVSSKSVSDYFKEKLQLATSMSLSFESETDEVSRGGIGSRLKALNDDKAEEEGTPRSGLGFGLLAKMMSHEATSKTTAQEEIPGTEVRKKREDGTTDRGADAEDEVHRKVKKKNKKRAKTQAT